MMEKLDEIDKVIVVCMVVAVAVIACLLMDPLLYLQVVDNREYLYASPSLGISMLPTIQSGDVLLVLEKESPNFNPAVGDVLVFWFELYGEFVPVAHRIYRVEGDVFFVKGDNNDEVDVQERVEWDRVIGVVFDVAPRNPLGEALYSSLLEN